MLSGLLAVVVWAVAAQGQVTLASSDDLASARALYAAGDYAKARVVFQAAANIGYPQAMTELGRMSFFGHGM